MKILSFLFFFFTFAFSVFGEDIKIIELHNQTIDEILLNAINDNEDIKNDINNEETKNSSSIIAEQDNVINSEEGKLNETITTLPDFWENANKDELLFLLDNLLPTNSLILNNALIKVLTLNSLPPQDFNEDEFNHFRIINLIKLGQRKKAFGMIGTLNEQTDYVDTFNLFKLNFYLSTYELNQACDFSNSINHKNSKINKNFLLKVDIFCTFIQNKIEEANFLNSLLEEMNDQDDYFQKIFLNLKESNKIEEDFSILNYDENSIPLYSAMIRVGEMPLNNKFLMHDPINFSIPIVLNGSTDISLRLKAAHKAYQKGIFNAESLSALYQTVDFSYDELTNTDSEKYNKNVEIGMTYFFQKASIQLLPITRVQSLVDFWKYAEKENLGILAYDISRSLIDKIEPSPELSEYGVQIARAHIHNNNFSLADKWILFAENYQSEDENFTEKIHSIKLFYNLKKTTNDNQFISILLESDLLEEIGQDTIKQEILLTILSVINENNDKKLKGNRNLLDNRSMPSRYLLNKIKESRETDNYGELLLSINISMIDKTWVDTHPEHLRIILTALQSIEIEHIFKDIILEILKSSEII